MPFVFCISFGFFIIHIFADFKYGFSSELYSMEKNWFWVTVIVCIKNMNSFVSKNILLYTFTKRCLAGWYYVSKWVSFYQLDHIASGDLLKIKFKILLIKVASHVWNQTHQPKATIKKKKKNGKELRAFKANVFWEQK